jgi:hypothetical protein
MPVIDPSWVRVKDAHTLPQILAIFQRSLFLFLDTSNYFEE